MKTIVILLEELSAKVMLEQLLPRIYQNDETTFQFIPFEGKQDLKDSFEQKIRRWITPNTALLVLIDQDGNDCCHLKQELVEKCQRATKLPCCVRIACHELENWYLGDLKSIDHVH